LTASTKGKLLVATPPLGDPNFDRSVVFVLEHTDEGAVGVVLNRPRPDDRLDELGDWTTLLTEPATAFTGGPVETDALIALAEAHLPDETAWTIVAGELGSVDLTRSPADVAARIDRLRIFRGYAGWGPLQLDGELDAGAWIVLAAEAGDVFHPHPDQLWRLVLRRQGGRLAWIADAPDDLSMN
jgi:putative transcriptional regulator